MWTHNSEKTLEKVLERINQVVPSKYINQRIISDDHSTDNTKAIAEKLGWKVYDSPSKGIVANVRNALNYVTCQFFASFEHDLLLNHNWWKNVSSIMESDLKVAVVQGIRVSTNPIFQRLESYQNCHVLTVKSLELSKQHQSLDNCLCRTEVVRYFGFNETAVPSIMRSNGWKWFVDHSLVSDHLHGEFYGCLKHEYKMAAHTTHTKQEVWRGFRLLLTSPLRSMFIALETKYPIVFFAYPIDRLAVLLGMFKGISIGNKQI